MYSVPCVFFNKRPCKTTWFAPRTMAPASCWRPTSARHSVLCVPFLLPVKWEQSQAISEGINRRGVLTCPVPGEPTLCGPMTPPLLKFKGDHTTGNLVKRSTSNIGPTGSASEACTANLPMPTRASHLTAATSCFLGPGDPTAQRW